MDQLVMRWKYEGQPEPEPDWGDLVCRTFRGTPEDINAWLDTVSFGLTEKREDEAFFRSCMYSHGELENDKFFIVEVDNVPAATFAVICDYTKKEGYIHMVACRPEYRGRGIGNLMGMQAVAALIRAGMQSAYLTTDDFRIPAIKSYLKAGFTPDIVNEEHRHRWLCIFDKIGK